MGIRVHKSMGYALTGKKFDEHVKSMEILENAKEELEYNPRWAGENREEISKFYMDNFPFGDLDDTGWNLAFHGWNKSETPCIRDNVKIHCEEYLEDEGLKFLQVIPLGQEKRWARFDDEIDYEEETSSHGQEDRIVRIGKCGIYPWLGMVRTRPSPRGLWKNKRAEEKANTMFPRDWSMMAGEYSDKAPALAGSQFVSHFKEDYRPMIPLEAAIVFFAIKEALRDPGAAYNDLRPTLVVQWA